jgi:energy-coupling factor transporter ATP-binding protein EcfA2
MAGAGASGNIGAPGYGGFISGEDWWQKNKNRLGERPDNFAANGLDQQGNPIEEIVDLSADTTASNIPAFDTTLDNTISKETTESTSEPTPDIYEENKKGTVFDLIDKYPTEDGGKYSVEFVVSILKNAADEGNANAAQILSNSPIAGPEGAFDGDGPAAGTGDPAASGAEGTGTPTGGTPQGQTGTPQGETSTPQGGAPTGGAGTVDTGTGSTPTVSTGSVLDQSGTENVNVDDQPIGLPNIPISTPRQPEKKAGMIMQISQSAPIVETVFDDILFEPKFTKLDNIPEFGVVGGLLRTLA